MIAAEFYVAAVPSKAQVTYSGPKWATNYKGDARRTSHPRGVVRAHLDPAALPIGWQAFYNPLKQRFERHAKHPEIEHTGQFDYLILTVPIEAPEGWFEWRNMIGIEDSDMIAAVEDLMSGGGLAV